MGGGDLISRTGLSYQKGEIGLLAHAFDEMAQDMQRREIDRQQAEKRVQVSKV